MTPKNITIFAHGGVWEDFIAILQLASLCKTSFLIQIKLEKHNNCARWPATKPINLDLGFLGPANLEEKAGALEHLPEVEDLTVSVTQIFGLVVQSVLSEMQNISV